LILTLALGAVILFWGKQEDASLLLLEVSVYTSAAAELFDAKVHLVAATLAWQHEVRAHCEQRGRFVVAHVLAQTCRARCCIPVARA